MSKLNRALRPTLFGILMLSAVLVLVIHLIPDSPPPFIGDWYGTDGIRRVSFRPDSSFADNWHNLPGTTYKWRSRGDVIRVFAGGRERFQFTWSLTPDGKSLELDEGTKAVVLWRVMPPTLIPARSASL